MREITIGDKTLRLMGSALSLLYYQQEFGRDLLGDMVGMMTGLAGFQAITNGGKVDPSKLDFSRLDSVAILRLIWTLARTAAGVGGQFPSFQRWLEEHEDIDIFDPDLLTASMEEATKIFFRRNKTVAPAAQR
jgi:hypothetical protein